MHPSLSVILLTLLSGPGFALMGLIAIVNMVGVYGGLSRMETLVAGSLAFVLAAAGMIASTQHLANPKNAWRAYTRWRTSWLAREGVFATAFFPFVFLYLLSVWMTDRPVYMFNHIPAVVATVLGLATIFSQGMLYACLRTIRQWNTPLVPVGFFTMGFAIAAVILTAIRVYTGEPVGLFYVFSVIMLVLAAGTKAIYYFWIGQPSGPSINTATGFTRGKVTQLDPGHTMGTFLTHEFGHLVPKPTSLILRTFVFVIGFVVPALSLFLAAAAQQWALGVVAVGMIFVGLGVERWLFFAEAQHVVNLYHGRQRC